MSLTIAVAQKNSALDNQFNNVDNGYLRIYSGTRPTNPDTALSGNTLLAELRFNATAFAAASGGTKTANAITQGTAAATGTASFFRALKSDGMSDNETNRHLSRIVELLEELKWKIGD